MLYEVITASLAAANKRIRNILKKNDEPLPMRADESLFQETAERSLLSKLDELTPQAQPLFDRGEYAEGLRSLWLGFEFLHHRWEIEWPWLCLGNSLAGLHQIIQWYSYTGILGGSLWIFLANLIIYAAIKEARLKNYTRAFSYLS